MITLQACFCLMTTCVGSVVESSQYQGHAGVCPKTQVKRDVKFDSWISVM